MALGAPAHEIMNTPKLILCLALAAGLPLGAGAQNTLFTYQGRLTAGAALAQGTFDLSFALFDAATDGSPVGATLTNAAVSVSNGLFTVALDFGAAAFSGAPRWLQIAARPNGPGAFTSLSPR